VPGVHVDPPASRREFVVLFPQPPDTVVPEELLSVTGSAVDARGRVVVEVRGEVDASTAPVLEACLDGQVGRRKVRVVVVDLEGVTFFGAAAVAVLVRVRRRCLARGARLVVRSGGQRRALLSLELSGLAPLVVSEEESGRRPGRRGPARAAGARGSGRGSPGRA
jgi:anti-anti-sigma factor